MRIRGAKSEMEKVGEDTTGMLDSVSKIREQVMAMSGVDILEVDGKTFKSTYQIVKELSQVYDKLSDIDQANLLELLGGKRGGTVLAAALQNFSIAESTKEGALNSAGSMDEQLAVYESSIQASLDKFKVSFQEFSTDLINSDFIKGVVNFGTTVITIIDELVKHIGVLGTALTGLGIAKIFTTAVNGAKSVEVASDGVEFLATALEAAQGSGSGLTGTIKGLSGVLGTLGAKAGGAGSALGGLFSSLGGFLASPVGIAAGVTALVAGAALYMHKRRKEQEEELRKQATAATEKWTNDKSSIDEYKAQYTELNDQLKNANLTESERIGIKQQLLDLQNQINEKYGADVSNLDLINGKYETQLNLISQIVEKEAHRSLQDNREAYQQSVDEMTKSREYTMYSNGSNSNLMKQIEWAYIRSGFKDQGDLSFKFTGDVSEADESIRTLMDRLEALKDTASETEKQFIDNVIGSASKLLKTNTEILQANQDNYRAYLEKSLYDDGFGDELAEYSKRMQAYNDALLTGDASKINEAKQQLDDYKVTVNEITSAHKEYGDFFDEVANSVDKTTEKVYQFKDIIEDGVAESTNDLSEYSDQIFRTVNDIKKLSLDGVDIQAILGNPQDAMYADLSQLAKLWNPDIDLSNKDDLQSFADFLMQAVYGADAFAGEVDLAKSSFEDFMKSASASIDTIDKVNSALVNSFASGGLSARIDAETGKLTGDVAEIIKAYKDLPGFDVAKVFERTADGIIVNRDALRELQSQQEKSTKEEFRKRIEEAQKNYIDALKSHDTSAIDYWKEQYDNVRLLAGAYDGATSAYQKWLDAQKMGEAGDMYDAVTKTALKRGKELYDAGLTGTNEFRSIAQLFSNQDLSNASRDEIYEAYEEGTKVVSKYFTKGREGAQAFADKMVELGYATKNAADDSYDFYKGFNTQDLADDLGISVDLVEAALKKLGDYDFDIHFELSDIPIEELKARLNHLQEGGNVDLKLRPVIDASLLNSAGWENAGEGAATVFTSTFANKAAELGKEDGVAMNFTPIMTDENGNFKGVLSPSELESYAMDVINGVRSDDLNLQIGGKFEGEDAIASAEDAAEQIHDIHDEMIVRGEFQFDDSDLNYAKNAIAQFEGRLNYINNTGITVDVKNDEQLHNLAEDLLNMPPEVKTELEIDGIDTVDEMVDHLTEQYEVKATVKTDTSNVQEPKNTTASVDYTTGNVEGISAQTAVANYTTGTVAPIENQTAKIDYTTSSVAPIENQKAKIDYSTNSVAKIPNQSTGIDYYTGSVESIPDQNARANYTVSVSGLNALPPDGEHRDIYIDVHTKQLYKGTVSRSAFQGMSRNSDIVGGASHARGMLGKVGLKRDESALINELGAEIVVRPSEDSWMIFNDGKPTFAPLKKGDVKIYCVHVQRCA